MIFAIDGCLAIYRAYSNIEGGCKKNGIYINGIC